MAKAVARWHIFHIAYDEQLLGARPKLLRPRGYSVHSVFGNEAAKAILGAQGEYDLFVIGHAAPEEIRLEMAHWLRQHYPKIKILALNPPSCERLDDLCYNAPYNEPDVWLPLAEAAASCNRRGI